MGITVHHSKQLFSSGLFEHGVERTSDDEPANLTGSCADFIQLCVAQEASGGVVVDVAVPSCGQETHSERFLPRDVAVPLPGTRVPVSAATYPNTECHPGPPEWRSPRNAG